MICLQVSTKFLQQSDILYPTVYYIYCYKADCRIVTFDKKKKEKKEKKKEKAKNNNRS